ncbi:exopolysaccharide biosynthesis polyprenyl glycosylphosphotransferase [Apibacter sp.]|uniref:exopolysaccharide biosynthesis polyprenyl glycosylphosphotransferase n=1 Tax=Apibacter sp. TaxID=2023709 RepID=UPI0025F2C5A1|nr:exopolysaccharide biosynthesis polyprenyl glycosylphosphotransferase [Apibacter sp.]MCT6870168.1 exopolysaccharide biosynthesis polyprenyl glycosylphosphotransferase [Apibacter sp.]
MNPYKVFIPVIQFIIDILIIIYLFFKFLKLQYEIHDDEDNIILLLENHYKALFLFIASWYFISEKTALYKITNSDFLELIKKIIAQIFIFAIIVFAISGLKSSYLFDNNIAIYFNISILILIAIVHMVAYHYHKQKLSRAIFIDSNSNTDIVIKHLSTERKIENFGKFIKHPIQKNQYKFEYEKINNFIEDNNIQNIFLSLNGELSKEVENILFKFSDSKYLIYIIPDFSYEFYKNSYLCYYGTSPIYYYKKKSNFLNRISKRLFDITLSLFIIIFVLSWLVPILSLIIKLTSKGPVIYKQERIGLNSKPFKIMKFRSMYIDAEYEGPKLSSESDPRITSIGKIMRKYRIDEFPQFINVLKGDMSIVGPRPERKYFIDKISQINPNYKKLHKVKPGITSIGQVYFGYAETVEEMAQRLKYDLLYLQNYNFLFDIKIIYLTMVVIIQGKGK